MSSVIRASCDEAAASRRAAPTAFIADPDPGRLALLADVLSRGGFQVRTEWESDANAFDVAVLDASVAPPASAVEVEDILGGGSDGARLSDGQETPIVFLADDLDQVDAGALATLAGSEYLVRPFAENELLHRVRALLEKSWRRGEEHRHSEWLRERTREVSSGVRTAKAPGAMAQRFVQGLGAALGVDEVRLSVFDTPRASRVDAVWHVDESDVGSEPEPPRREVEEAARALWTGDGVLLIGGTHGDEGSAASEGFAQWVAKAGGSSLIVPLGEGDMAFGLIWIRSVDKWRLWSHLEQSVVQHVTADLAYSLRQSHLIEVEKQLVQRLQQLDQDKNDLVATVNHELRTPLTSITASLDLLEEEMGDDAPKQVMQLLDVASRNAERLRALVEDMMTVSQLDTESEQAFAIVDLRPLVREVVRSLSPLSSSKNVSVDVHVTEAPLYAAGDETLLVQALTNVVGNAIKFTPPAGFVSVDASLQDAEEGAGRALIAVTDTGVGIPADDIPRLFTRFFRASNATGGKIPGTGLGLAITRDIVRRHGGDIRVDSALGRGTRFTVELPVAPYP